jgi:hypothetical protein
MLPTLFFLLSVKMLAHVMILTAPSTAEDLVERPLPGVASLPVAVHSHEG